VDRLERIGILSLAALSKARELRKIPLDAALRAKVAEIMKTVRDVGKKVKEVTDAASKNGILNRATTERALDRILKSLQDANQELDELLAQVRK
jgi:polyhydroxyalkanoate synthesis regulator phasin